MQTLNDESSQELGSFNNDQLKGSQKFSFNFRKHKSIAPSTTQISRINYNNTSLSPLNRSRKLKEAAEAKQSQNEKRLLIFLTNFKIRQRMHNFNEEYSRFGEKE